VKGLDSIQAEFNMMKTMDHPYIVKCYDSTETTGFVFLFLELCTGGELFDKIISSGKFTEAMAADVMHKSLLALQYMHSMGITHRDLKPENMLLEDDSAEARVKLTDFGLSHMLDDQSALMTDPVGTPGYVAPEVLTTQKNGGYDCQVDVWSMGVILYILLCGSPPFYAKRDNELFAKIKAGRYYFSDPIWSKISDGAKDCM
jgi:calcium-dependent protein kinase